jgi:hypothetical protein
MAESGIGRVVTEEMLTEAARAGDLESLTVWPIGRTPLILAALMGHLAVVRCLIELGTRVGAVDSVGDTALHCARVLEAVAMRQCTFCLKKQVPTWTMSIPMVRLSGTRSLRTWKTF